MTLKVKDNSSKSFISEGTHLLCRKTSQNACSKEITDVRIETGVVGILKLSFRVPIPKYFILVAFKPLSILRIK